MSNQELDTLLKNKKLYEKNCTGHKSDVWRSFSMLYYKDSIGMLSMLGAKFVLLILNITKQTVGHRTCECI